MKVLKEAISQQKGLHFTMSQLVCCNLSEDLISSHISEKELFFRKITCSLFKLLMFKIYIFLDSEHLGALLLHGNTYEIQETAAGTCRLCNNLQCIYE